MNVVRPYLIKDIVLSHVNILSLAPPPTPLLIFVELSYIFQCVNCTRIEVLLVKEHQLS